VEHYLSSPAHRRGQGVHHTGVRPHLVASKGDYGFTHGANEDACREPGQNVCEKDAWASDDADQTYIFSAAEHMTTHANELLADYVKEQINEKFGK
jgi:hypothetical protein